MPSLSLLARHPLHERPYRNAVAVTPRGWLTHARRTRLEASTVRDGVRWDRPVAQWLRALVADGPRCWSLAQDGVLTCRDVETGDRLWESALPWNTGHLTSAGEWLRVGGWRGYTAPRLLDAATGAVLRPELTGRGSLEPAASGPTSVLITSEDGRMVQARGVPSDDLLGEWSLPEAILPDEGRPAFVPHGPGRWLVRAGEGAVWEIRPGEGAATEVFRHDAALSGGVWSAAGAIWVREPRGGVLIGHRPGRTVRVAAGRPHADGVIATAQGLVVAQRRPGILFLISPDGEIRSRLPLDVQIEEVRALGDDQVLVLGKGALFAVGV